MSVAMKSSVSSRISGARVGKVSAVRSMRSVSRSSAVSVSAFKVTLKTPSGGEYRIRPNHTDFQQQGTGFFTGLEQFNEA